MPKDKSKEAVRGYDITSAIIDFESGNLNNDKIVELFQHLVDTGMAWQLQGEYGRTAKALIEAGLVTPKNDEYFVAPGVKKKITGNPLIDGFISP
jgi:hypothetical protein